MIAPHWFDAVAVSANRDAPSIVPPRVRRGSISAPMISLSGAETPTVAQQRPLNFAALQA